ncbi:MAG: hypothetical protein LC751_20875 [Actinobacteria bacterium]|nr:hypothetical protein [Actinomycetota bacterium]
MEGPPAERYTAREGEKENVDEEVGPKFEDALSKLGCNLTVEEVSRRLGVSEESAQALIVAGLRGMPADD